MKKLIVLMFSVACAMMIAGCQNASKQQIGAVSGAAVGGLIGSQFGRGTGQLVGVGAGAVAGALIGGSIGKSMDKADQMETERALEKTPTNHTASWTNPDTNARYSVKPTKTYYRHSRPCREYTTKAIIAGKTQTVYGRACRQADGSWKVVG